MTRAAALTALTLAAAALIALPGAAQEFRSPSGNIGCLFYGPDAGDAGHAVRCDIAAFTPTWTGPPEGCALDWQGILFLDETGAGQRGCAGDVGARPDAPVLGYGEVMRAGGILCRSERAGVTCTNAAGHGIFLSRAVQHIF